MTDYSKYEGHTPGPWYHQHGGMAPHFVTSGEEYDFDEIQIVCGSVDCIDSIANSKLIADAPALLARVKELEAELAERNETIDALEDLLASFPPITKDV